MRIAISWLDVKLGLRMLARYPGLSLAGAFAIAMVVACGVAVGVFDAVVNGTLPFRGRRARRRDRELGREGQRGAAADAV